MPDILPEQAVGAFLVAAFFISLMVSGKIMSERHIERLQASHEEVLAIYRERDKRLLEAVDTQAAAVRDAVAVGEQTLSVLEEVKVAVTEVERNHRRGP